MSLTQLDHTALEEALSQLEDSLADLPSALDSALGDMASALQEAGFDIGHAYEGQGGTLSGVSEEEGPQLTLVGGPHAHDHEDHHGHDHHDEHEHGELAHVAEAGSGSGGGGSQLSPGTIRSMADYLLDGYWEAQGSSRHAFDTSSSNTITVNLDGLNAAGARHARWALETWEMVADINFVETSGRADITFDDNESGAYAMAWTYGSTTDSAEVNIHSSWLDTGSNGGYGTHGMQTYIHEIGHALGLGHQGQYNGSANFNNANFANDSWQCSVMSYFSQRDNPYVDATHAYVATAMMADIVAIQELYGAARGDSATAGSTTYFNNSNLGGALGDYFDGLANGSWDARPLAVTLYDQGGVDTIDLRYTNADCEVSLQGGTFSDIGASTGIFGIALGTQIENLRMAGGDDTAVGNGARNKIWGGGGSDSLSGLAGRDKLFGQGGNDVLQGGGGGDRLKGQAGSDELDGGGGRDRLIGGGGADTLEGGGGRDILIGGGGNDVLTGGRHADTFVFGGRIGRDEVTDFTSGLDTLQFASGLVGGASNGADIVSTYASIVGGDVVFDFGGNNTVTLAGHGSLAGLADDIAIA